ncbi:MAG: hypothetical protein WC302_00805 [Candidatus Paceibacterota bacterium]|jgi:hypothetical protein
MYYPSQAIIEAAAKEAYGTCNYFSAGNIEDDNPLSADDNWPWVRYPTGFV